MTGCQPPTDIDFEDQYSVGYDKLGNYHQCELPQRPGGAGGTTPPGQPFNGTQLRTLLGLVILLILAFRLTRH